MFLGKFYITKSTKRAKIHRTTYIYLGIDRFQMPR